MRRIGAVRGAFACALIGALTALQANAVMISVDPGFQNAAVGDDVTVDIIVSDLGPGEEVGGVSFELSFSNAILRGGSFTTDPDDIMDTDANALNDLSFGFLGGAGDGSPLDVYFVADIGLDSAALELAQGAGFRVAQVVFEAIGNGLSPLNLSPTGPGGTFLSDGDGFELASQGVNGAVCVGDPDVDCVVARVSEPGTLGMLGIALGLLAIRRRKQSV
jgi:hypothetical protein